MVRPKDKFWEYAEDLNGRFKCNFCERDFPGGAPRLKSHLSGVKGRDVDICTQVPEDVQAAACLAIRGPNKKVKTTTILSKLEDNGTIAASSNSFLKMSETHEKDKSLVDKKLAQFLISNNVAFNVIETSSFINFVKAIVEFGRDYEPPSCSTLKVKFIPGFAVEVEKYLKDVKESWASTGCTLMLDMCCDMKEQAILNVIAYSPRGAVFLNSFDISKHQKDDVHLTDIVSSIIKDIGTHHVVQLITCKATIFDSVGDMLNSKYPQIFKTRCVACEIHSLLKDIYNKSQWVNEVIDDAKLIVKYMNEDTSILSLMRQYTNNRELKHPCMTKFASTYKMLQSIFDNENELQLLVASAEWRALDDNKKEIAEKITTIISNGKFWSRGREVLLVLKPIVQVLCLVDGDGSTSGYLYEAMESAEASIKQGCGGNILDYALILELFEERRKRVIHPIHTAAAFLNPAYMWSKNFKEDRKMKDGMDFMVSKLVAGEDKISFLEEVQLYRMKVPKLFTETAILALKAYHPRVWWDHYGDHLPVLRQYAVQILSQPCNSSCEQRWSAFEVAQTKKMNRQTAKMSDNFVHVRMNTMIMENFNTMEERCWKPIDLEKCNELPDYVDLEQGWENDSSELINKNFENNVMNVANPLCSDSLGVLPVTKIVTTDNKNGEAKIHASKLSIDQEAPTQETLQTVREKIDESPARMLSKSSICEWMSQLSPSKQTFENIIVEDEGETNPDDGGDDGKQVKKRKKIFIPCQLTFSNGVPSASTCPDNFEDMLKQQNLSDEVVHSPLNCSEVSINSIKSFSALADTLVQSKDEFLSMKLASGNPQLDFNIERFLAKDILQSRAGPSSTIGISPDMPMAYPILHPSQLGIIPAALAGLGSPSDILQRTINSQLTPMTRGSKKFTEGVLPVTKVLTADNKNGEAKSHAPKLSIDQEAPTQETLQTVREEIDESPARMLSKSPICESTSQLTPSKRTIETIIVEDEGETNLDDGRDDGKQDCHWKQDKKRKNIFIPCQVTFFNGVPSASTCPDNLEDMLKQQNLSDEFVHTPPNCSEFSIDSLESFNVMADTTIVHSKNKFLSMKLASWNPRLDFNIEGFLAKDILQSQAGPSSTIWISPDISMAYPILHPSQLGIIPAALPGLGSPSDILQRTINSQLTPMTRGYKNLIKVSKRGSFGRSIDITRYKGYNELRHDLAGIFGMEGQLEDPQNSYWKLVYVDHENDIILVGEDPWEEFLCCVRCIKILSSVEVQQMSLDGDW